MSYHSGGLEACLDTEKIKYLQSICFDYGQLERNACNLGWRNGITWRQWALSAHIDALLVKLMSAPLKRAFSSNIDIWTSRHCGGSRSCTTPSSGVNNSHIPKLTDGQTWSFRIRLRKLFYLNKGQFINYVRMILAIFDPLPSPCKVT